MQPELKKENLEMARSSVSGDGSATEATTLIFPKKSAWEEAAEAKRQAKKRSSSANGTFSKVVSRLVEEEHADRRALRMVLALDAIEDDSDLHTTIFHLIDGLKKLGVLKRAMAQEELFDDHRIDDAALTRASTAGAKDKKPRGRPKKDATDALPEGVTRIGDAARKVTEAAGGPGAA
jgi:hypothetical protein